MPWDLGGRIWVAPRRGCVNAYMPIYFGVTVIPPTLTMDTPEKAAELHFKRGDEIYDRNNSLSWWNFVAVADSADKEFSKRIQQRTRIKEYLQTSFIKLAEKLEKEYLPIYKKEPVKAATMINNFELDILNRTLAENNKFLGK
jgi:dipeptidase